MNQRPYHDQLPAMAILVCGVVAVALAFVISMGGFDAIVRVISAFGIRVFG
jgi:hypothetical protein